PSLCRAKAHGSLSIWAGMAMQSANTLQQHVHWTQIGYQHIRIQIETLLKGLGTDHDARSTRSFFTELSFDSLIQDGPILTAKWAVVQSTDAVDYKKPISIRCACLKRCQYGDGRRYSIADHQNLHALRCRIKRHSSDGLRIIDNIECPPRDYLRARSRYHRA